MTERNELRVNKVEPEDQGRIYLKGRKAWRKWLEKNHAKKSCVWLVFYKKHTGKPSVPYEDAVEEALCFGWIDSRVKSVDQESYVQKFSKRKPTSTWSASNKKRVQKMIRLGKMTEAGLIVIEQAKRNGAWSRLEVIDKLVVIPELKAALSRNKEAGEQFRRIPISQKKQFLWWIETAKREETRNKRIEKTIELLSRKKSMSDYYYTRQTKAR